MMIDRKSGDVIGAKARDVMIAESAFAEDSPAIRHALERLRVQGLSIALDDFGTGYSALEYLARFPVDELKMDRSFVQATGDGERHRELCRAFIAMAGALRLTLTAEGVETDAQAAFLRRAGCSRMQGWHFAHAMPAFLRGPGADGGMAWSRAGELTSRQAESSRAARTQP